MRTNFSECHNTFVSGYYPQYKYYGPVRGVLKNTSPSPNLITVQGCRDLCGERPQYYSWVDMSSTITTWVLPVIGLLLQAPFESNVNFMSVLALARWIGNPIASLSYVFWNIKVTGKCALMVDMALPYEDLPAEGTQCAYIRDSLYILSVMNQFLIQPDIVEHGRTIAAEKLLRIALFSDELELAPSLTDRRTQLAKSIRAFRKKGVIPVFVSTAWFLVALAISIQLAFDERGENKAAHDLALGLLLAFLPVFVLACIVDRNTIATDRVSYELNLLLSSVRDALRNDGLLMSYAARISQGPDFFDWVRQLNTRTFDKDFFTNFAGQARIRWHYGVAHPLLCSFEDSFIADRGRDWLRNPNEARAFMRDHRLEDHQLIWFDPWMIWQIASSFCVVYSSVGGAFILSYFTPTVGLGCRSGGYMVYLILATGVFTIEMICWGLSRASYLDTLLRVMEVGNSIWLIYIVSAQTVGSYLTCDCMSSIWAGRGGYTDFGLVDYTGQGIYHYWGPGTGLSGIVMAVGLAYIVGEYCTQSHLATEDFESARQGIKFTRRFKKYTYPLRLLLELPDRIIFSIGNMFGYQKKFSKTLTWDWREN